MTDTAKPNALIELLITIVIPSVILMKLSGPKCWAAPSFSPPP